MAYTDEEINEVYDRCGRRCFYCDMTLSFHNYGVVGARAAWEIDHFIPIASGGAHQPYNWVAACIGFNTEKLDLLPWEFNMDKLFPMSPDYSVTDVPGPYLPRRG